MTKKHLEALAAILRDARTVSVATQRIAEYAAQDNPRFDRARFLKACGLDEVYRIGDGTICRSEKEARAYADGIARRSNVILSVERVVRRAKAA